VHGHRAGFRRAYPPRWVNSCYFDTVDLTDVHEGLAGIPSRRKLRLRWYGDLDRFDSAVLEHKQKEGALGCKVSVPVEGPVDLKDMDWRSLSAHVRAADLGPLAWPFSRRTVPTSVVRYSRRYLLSGSRRVRLTVDSELVVYDQTLADCPNLTRRDLQQHVVVVEVKAEHFDEDEVRAICNDLPLRQVSFSKYVTGRTR
jgi:SPX domain protein involved in polyphosphate accumulation